MSTFLKIKLLGQQPYASTLEAMREFTLSRQSTTIDELWLVEHPPVFTQGQAGKAEHILDAHHIPIIHSDRGGQVTYHGPGQLIAYVLLNLKQKNLGIRQLVNQLEQIIIATLASLDISAYARTEAPGVYVDQDKIGSIGLRVRKSCSYHGIALNHQMDLTPFTYINPCGYHHLKMTQISDFNKNITPIELQNRFIEIFCQYFDYRILS